jgi:hypothetical protein
MIDGPDKGSIPASEPLTRQLSRDGTGTEQLAEPMPTISSPPASGFAALEGPTLSSPASTQEPPRIVALEARVQSLELHLEETERELGDVYGAVEHLVKCQEVTDRTLRQQRHGRYLMWGTVIAILAMLWLTLRSRIGLLGPG